MSHKTQFKQNLPSLGFKPLFSLIIYYAACITDIQKRGIVPPTPLCKLYWVAPTLLAQKAVPLLKRNCTFFHHFPQTSALNGHRSAAFFFLSTKRECVMSQVVWIAELHWYQSPSRTELIPAMWKLQEYHWGNRQTFPSFWRGRPCVWNLCVSTRRGGCVTISTHSSGICFLPAVQSLCFKSGNTSDTDRELTHLNWRGLLQRLTLHFHNKYQ